MNEVSLLKILGITVLVTGIFYALLLLNLFTQLTRYKNYWDKNNQDPPTSKEILYVALGDSTAQGIGATHPDKSYPGVIRQSLAEHTGSPVRLVNLSKSGAKVRDVIDSQIPALDKLTIYDGTVITIEIGANDMINFNADKFRSDMDELMDKLPANTLISDLPYFGTGRFKNKELNVVQANQIMYELAIVHRFKLVPLHDKTRANDGFRTFAVDLFHPSNKGYRENWAPVFLERIYETR